MKTKAKLYYGKGELIAWIDVVEEAKRLGLRPEDVRKLIEEATK
jgi:hypothetical protein